MSTVALAGTEHLVDTIRFDLAVQKTVIQEYVTLSVNVTSITHTTGTKKNAEVDKRIKEALKKFVDTRWEFRNVRRYKEAMGFERIELTAQAQVHAKEDNNLEERAEAASSEGLSLARPTVDYALPKSVVGETLKELGEETFRLIEDRLAAYRKLTGRNWRIGDVEFDPKDVRYEDYNPKRSYIEERQEDALLRAGIVKLPSRIVLKANFEAGSA